MSFSLTKIIPDSAPELTLAAVTASLTAYGLHQLEPSYNLAYLVAICVDQTYGYIFMLRPFVNYIGTHLPEKYRFMDEQKITSMKAYNLTQFFLITIESILMASIYRFLGHKMGCQVPSYARTVGYLALASSAFWNARSVIEFISYSYNGKPVFG